MAPQILQVNFTFSIPRAQYEQECAASAPILAGIAGLRWKVWIINEATHEAGGIYLFNDEASLQAFLAPLTGMLQGSPAYSNVSIKQFDILGGPTAVTRGPVE